MMNDQLGSEGVEIMNYQLGRINKNNLLTPNSCLLTPEFCLLNLEENINFRSPGDFQPVLGFNVVIGG